MSEKQTAGIGKGTPGPGRKTGIPNRATTEFRQTVQQLLDDNRANVGKWLALVAEGEKGVGADGEPWREPGDPGKALDLLTKLAEFAAPKLGRLEHVGEGGGPLLVQVDYTGRRGEVPVLPAPPPAG